MFLARIFTSEMLEPGTRGTWQSGRESQVLKLQAAGGHHR